MPIKDFVHGRPARALLPVADAALASAFAAVARLRGGRPLHPRGVVHAAVLEVEPAPGRPLGVPLLDVPARHRALVRLSRAAGLPARLPDVHGVAVRLLGAHGPGRHQDLLLNTSSPRRRLRHLPLPGRGPGGRFLSTMAPTGLAGTRYVVAAAPLPGTPSLTWRDVLAAPDGGGLAWRLVAARDGGPWRPLGTLRVGARVGDHDGDDDALELDVHVNTGGGIAPVGTVQALRHSSYRAAQRVRRARRAARRQATASGPGPARGPRAPRDPAGPS